MSPAAATASAAGGERPTTTSTTSPSSTTEAAAMGSDARRFDRRQCNQLRPPLCELGPLNRADGSARFAMVRAVELDWD
jgi:exosome complex RNA-binding protein Rrp42 (RNase PH superfamily)